MTEITTLSRELAREVRRIVLDELAGAELEYTQYKNPRRKNARKMYYAKVTTEVTAASGTTAGEGEVTLYRRDSSDDSLTTVVGTTTVYSMAPILVSVNQYRFVIQDLFGDYWIVPDSRRTGVYKAPGGGIAARSGTTLGSATCTLQSCAGGTLTAKTHTATVYNLDENEAVGANAYIQVKEDWEGTLLVDWEAC